MHNYEDLIAIFNRCFLEKYNTRLVKGGGEPIYLPASEHQPHHELIFAHGFFASALHECSHWLIAGDARRQLVDFGYWYAPDGRTAEQQVLFQQVEVKPQAIEWILSVACGFRFRVSVDNLNGQEAETDRFKQSVFQRVAQLCEEGLSERTALFREALCDFYHTYHTLRIEDFDVATI